jgi:hypothetical protein
MANSAGRVELDVGVNRRSLSKDLAAAGKDKGILGAAKKLGLALGAAFAVGKMIQFGKSAVKLASDLTEVQNVVDKTFGASTAQVNEFAKSALKVYGLSELSAKRFSSTLGAMLKSSGLAQQDMTDMAITLTGVIGDFASFYNLDHETAFNKIRAGISGETEPLKQLGINMSVANLEAHALANGIKKSYQQMSQAEQVQLRYSYLLAKSGDAQGDFASTTHTWANQTRVLTEQFKIFQQTMGQGLMSALVHVVKWLNAVIARMQVLAQYFSQFMQALFGKQEAAGGGGIAGLGDAMADGAAGAGELASGIKAAGKAAKGALSNFDQLNTLSQSTGSGADAGGAGAIPNVQVDLGMPEIKDIDESTIAKIAGIAAEKFKEFFVKPLSNIDFSSMKGSMENLKSALAPLAQQAFEGLKWGYDNVLVPIATWTIQDFLPKFLDALSAGFTATSIAVKAAGPALENIWDKVLKPMGAWVGDAVILGLEKLTGYLEKIGKWMSENPKSIEVATYAVAGFFGAWQVAKLVSFTVESAKATIEIVNMAKKLVILTAAKVADKWETLILIGLYAKDYTLAALGVIKQLVVMTGAWIAKTAAVVASTVATTAFTTAAWLGAAATKAFGIAVAILTSPITLVIAAIAALIAIVYLLVKNWDTVKEAASKCWDWIKSVWKGAGDWFNDTVIKPIAGFFEGLWSSITKGIQSMTDKLNIFKGDASKAQIAANNPTSQYAYTPPKTATTSGGKSSVGALPFANGGIIKAPTLAMMGENRKKEVVFPLENTGFIQSFAGKVADAVSSSIDSQGGSSSDSATIILKVNESELARATIGSIKKLQRQTGSAQLQI